MDDERRFAYVNRRFVEIFGYEPDKATTSPEWVLQIFPDDGYRQEAIDAWHADLERSVPGQIRPPDVHHPGPGRGGEEDDPLPRRHPLRRDTVCHL
ncbi:hypothetical protein [Methanoculleus chikugoensis]|uniref:hypothetical protein n=1 Tax=Methanoculleus chikugoensis TaxID=118126 RepID=UPI001FB31F01|nr:hypothetical protein [Methanoculleus chikugoensis]